MDCDFIDWDDPADPAGNVGHIAANGVTPEEFEDVLTAASERGPSSRTTGRPVRFGWTATGKHLIIVFDREEADGFVIVRPVTAYEVPPVGEEG